jgi:lysophospholipase L1-like esterase
VRVRRGLVVGALCAVAVAGAPTVAVADDDGSTWTHQGPTSFVRQELPTSVAALGDSITRGFNACGFYTDCARRSWSTGSDSSVDSHRQRLEAMGARITEANNFARSGSRVEHLPGQMARAVEAGADYVTIEIGANDACRADVGSMTSVADFRARVREALGMVRPGMRVFVASVPDLARLWEVGHRSRMARMAWDKLDICRSMLVRPTSTKRSDVARRATVRERVQAYNAELAAACNELGDACRWDKGAVFGYRFTLNQLTRWDYFHPDKGGQRALSDATWQHTFFR